jgi:hypothetical protein
MDRCADQSLPGEPDRLSTNPNYRSGPQMRLYDLHRVEQIESQADVAAALAKASIHREFRGSLARAAAERSRSTQLQETDELDFFVPRRSPENVRLAAIKHYNERNAGGPERSAGPEDDSSFLNRITLNFIRHQLTDYDRILSDLEGKIGKTEAYFLIRDRFDQKILATYPEFAT